MDLVFGEKTQVLIRAQWFLALDEHYDVPKPYALSGMNIDPQLFPTIIKVVPTGSRAERLFLDSSDQDYIIECGPVLVDPPDTGYWLMSFFTKRRNNFYCKATPNPGFYVVYDGKERSVPPATVQMCIAPYLVSAAPGTSILNELKNQNHAKAALPEALSFGNKDDVVALRLSKWPDEMKESLMGRLQWLSNKSMEAVAAADLYLVRKSHPRSENPKLEWRLSFSMLEIEIVKRIGEVQRRGYLLAKQFLKIVDKASVAASYELKNTMLWLLHEQTWASQCTDAGRFMWSLLEQLHQFYTKETLPNFFIPEQNLLELKLMQEMVGFRAMLGNCIANRGSLGVLRIFASTIISNAVFFHKEYLVTYLDDVKVFKTGIAVELYVSALKDLNCIFTVEALKQEVDEKRLRKAVQLLHDAWFVLSPETCTERSRREACMIDVFKSVRDCIAAFTANFSRPEVVASSPSFQLYTDIRTDIDHDRDKVVTSLKVWSDCCWTYERSRCCQRVFEKVSDSMFEVLEADLTAAVTQELRFSSEESLEEITRSILEALRIFADNQKLRLRTAYASSIRRDFVLAECCMLSGMHHFQDRFLRRCMAMCSAMKEGAAPEAHVMVTLESTFHSNLLDLFSRYETERHFWECVGGHLDDISKGLLDHGVPRGGDRQNWIEVLHRNLSDTERRYSVLHDWLYDGKAKGGNVNVDFGVRMNEKQLLIREILEILSASEVTVFFEIFSDATSELRFAVSNLYERIDLVTGSQKTIFKYPDALYLINWDSLLYRLRDPALYLMFKDMYKYKERNEGRTPFKFELPSVLEYLIYKAQYLCEYNVSINQDPLINGCWVLKDCSRVSSALVCHRSPIRVWNVDLTLFDLLAGYRLNHPMEFVEDPKWKVSLMSLFSENVQGASDAPGDATCV